MVYYRLQGKRKYELRTTPFSFDDDGPNTYSIEYAYEPLVDCYESNDTRAEAKRIPLNKTITAYQHAGIGPSDSLFVRDSGADWYTFDLAEAKTVKLKGKLPGKDGPDGENAALFSVLLADGVTPARCAGSEPFTTDPVSATENVETCEGLLEPGKYLVKLDLFTSQPAASEINEPARKPWNTPYTFVLEAK